MHEGGHYSLTGNYISNLDMLVFYIKATIKLLIRKCHKLLLQVLCFRVRNG